MFGINMVREGWNVLTAGVRANPVAEIATKLGADLQLVSAGARTSVAARRALQGPEVQQVMREEAERRFARLPYEKLLSGRPGFEALSARQKQDALKRLRSEGVTARDVLQAIGEPTKENMAKLNALMAEVNELKARELLGEPGLANLQAGLARAARDAVAARDFNRLATLTHDSRRVVERGFARDPSPAHWVGQAIRQANHQVAEAHYHAPDLLALARAL